MSSANIHERLGISIFAGAPLVGAGYDNFLSATYREEIAGYSHVKSANGGYKSASITLILNTIDIDEWYMNGIGRHIETQDHETKIAWEGFVNRISINIGGLSASIGPLMDTSNRVSVVYSEISSTNADVSGSSDETTIAENADSQTRYGIIEKVLSAGNALLTEAEQVRDTYLEDFANPPRSRNLSVGQSSAKLPSVTLECAGYKEWLEAYVYNNTSSTFYTGTEKIIDVLDADPNNIIGSQENIETNAIGVSELEKNNNIAASVINTVVQAGGGSDERWIFGVLNDRKPYYRAVEYGDYDYTHNILNNSQRVYTQTGQLVYPWQVEAGKWIITEGALVSPGMVYSDIKTDLSAAFIEEVSFSAPFGLTITGGRHERLPQMIAKLGVASQI